MNAIASELTSTTIANEIRMHRAANENVVLLVEGDTDARLFKKFINSVNCTLTVCWGRKRLLEIITLLHQSEFEKVIGICDKDFAESLGYPEYDGHVVFTDNNDIEIDIITSQALDHILSEFGSNLKVSNAKANNNGCIPSFLMHHAKSLGALRLASKKHGWGMDFEDMTFRYCNANSPEIDINRTIIHLIGRTKPWCGLTAEEVRRLYDIELHLLVTPEENCSGHDVIRILGRSLKKALGTTNDYNNPDGAKILEKIMRLTYEYRHFKLTKMYLGLKNWETLNQVDILHS